MSGRSFGSRRITLRILSDTSSLVSLDEYKNRNSSGLFPEDDSVTVSSRDTGLLVQKMKTVMNGRSGSTVQDFHTLYGLESESHASAFDERYPADPSASIERNTQWLRDQTSRAINGIMTLESVVSDGSSVALSGDDLDAQSPFDSDLSLQQDNSRYYYTYTSGSSSSAMSASAAHDDVSIGEHGSHRIVDWRDPKLHWLASQKTLAQPQSKSGSSDYPSPSSSSNRQSMSSSTSDSLSRTADTPPEVRQLVPPACTDCSACGRTPRSRASPGANGHANGYAGKVRANIIDVSMFDPLAHPPRTHTNGKPFPVRPCPLPTLPSTPSASSASSSSTVAGDSGYELYPGFFETAGVLHALAGGAAPDEPTSALSEDQRTLSQLRHAAPRQKGHFLHAYLEKLRCASGWIDVEQDNISEYTICNTSLTTQRYKCASCKNFVLCCACYNTRNTFFTPFLDVPDRPHRSRSEPDLELTNNLNIDGLGDKSGDLMDIVGARFHCTICESVDICSNYEAAGLPGNLDTDDGDPHPLKSEQSADSARPLWTGRDSLYVQRTPRRRVRTDSLREADAVTIIGSGSKHARSGCCGRKALDLRIACKGCNQSNVGVRFQCATCPATKTQSYSLCANCEQGSHLLHDPMHIFFKLPRPVDCPIESQFAILPILYVPIAFLSHIVALSSAVPAYLATLYHNAALCDHCMDRIKGVWFRCVYCAKDLCDVCKNLNPHAHDHTHFFYVFKAPVNTLIVAELDNLEGSPPVLNYPMYYS
ncbi:hypothetical protein DFH11DRAFT_1690419 [Phellopilus nigrolimitatus]|nr:hypothetical protein DFH11DRAFT_1690419 [Phellopilus nigrolimitatus]